MDRGKDYYEHKSGPTPIPPNIIRQPLRNPDPDNPKMKPRDERIPGIFEPMLSYVECAELQAQIAGMILAAKTTLYDRAWDKNSSERCEDASEQARQLLTHMGLFRSIPGVEYGA